MRTIQLTKKLVITSVEDANKYRIERWYQDYFTEFDILLQQRGIHPDREPDIANKQIIVAELDRLYSERIGLLLVANDAFSDLTGIQLDIQQCLLATKSFTRANKTNELEIRLTTQPMNLIQTFGHILILAKPSSTAAIPLLSIELDSITTVYSLSEIITSN